MIERFLDALAAAKLDLSAEEVADALWLAPHMRFAVTTGELLSDLTKLPIKSPGISESPEVELEAKEGRKVPAEKAGPAEIHLPASPGAAAGGLGRRGRAVQSPGVPALPGALGIARSLRPFKRRVPTRRRYLLDEEATVARIAEGGPKVPVLKPAPERWLELALVVDQSPTMVLWRQTVAELLRLLECHGAFRDVRLWSLATDGGQIGLRTGLGTGARPGNRSPRELVDPSGRRLVVVVSDCVSEAWHRGEVTAQALSIWARSGPLVLLQVLPERLWPRTGLAMATDAHLAGSLPGLPSHRLRVRGRQNQWRPVGPGELAFPVVTLEPRPLSAWARMVAGFGGGWVPGKLLELEAVAEETGADGTPESDANDLPTAAQRIRRFRAASPTARKLAGYLAAVPLSLPVMRLVQAVMLPESRQVHLAEVFLGGLLKQVSSDADISPEEVQYEFEDGVRDLLLNEVRRSETLQVLEEVSAWLDRQQGVKRGFRALIEDPSSTEEIAVSEGSRPFASVTAGVLTRLGLQRLQQVSPELEQAISTGFDKGIGTLEGTIAALDVRLDRIRDSEDAPQRAGPSFEIDEPSEEAATQQELGDLYVRTDRLREAEDAYQSALLIYQQIEDLFGEANTRQALGDLYVRTDRLHEAEDAYQSALTNYQQIEERLGEAGTRQTLGDLYVRMDRLREAEDAYQSGLTIYQEIEERLGEADTQRALGDIYVRTDRLREAEDGYQSALTIYQEIENRLGEADTRRALGDIYVRTNRLREAEDAYQSVLTIYQQIEDRLGEANTRRVLGDIYVRTDLLPEAENAYQSALTIYQQIGNRLGEANTRQVLSDLYMRTDRLREAENAYKSALTMYQQIGSRLGEANIRHSLSALYVRTDRLREAEDSFQSALTMYQQIGSRLGEANTRWALSALYEHTDRLREAEDGYQSALAIYQQIEDRLGEANIRKALGEFYERTDRMREAADASQSTRPLYQPIEDRFEKTNLPGPKVFVSYSHKDQKAIEQLQRFLRPLERNGLVTAWADHRQADRDDWENKIDQALDETTVAILLISQDFLDSHFITEKEVPRILAREATGQLTIVPVFLSTSLVRDVGFPDPRNRGRSEIRLTKFQGYGSPDKPLSDLQWSARERVYENLARFLLSLSGGSQKSVAGRPQALGDRYVLRERWRDTERQEPVRLGILSMVGWESDMKTRNHAVLDLGSFFDGRFIIQNENWKEEIFPRLRNFLIDNIDPRRPVQLDIAAHSSIAFATGWILEAKSGLDVKVLQRVLGEGEIAWDPRDGSGRDGPLWLDRPDIALSPEAPDVALALAVSQREVAAEVEVFIRTKGLPAGRIIDATIAPEPGSRSVQGGAHALHLAQELLPRLRRRAPHERKGALHFFCAAPNALLFYLGQLTRSLGRIVIYEYAFGSPSSYGRYQRAIELPPSLEEPPLP